MRISTDPNCKNVYDKSCSNYNWFTQFGKPAWLVTANADSSREAFKFDGKVIIISKTRTPSSVYPVFNLIDKAIYAEGTGTETDPYLIFMESVTEDKKTKK